MRLREKLFASILAVVMIITVLPLSAFAADQKSTGAGVKLVQNSYEAGVLSMTVQAKEPDMIGVSSITVILSYDNSQLTLIDTDGFDVQPGSDNVLDTTNEGYHITPCLRAYNTQRSRYTDYSVKSDDLYTIGNRTAVSAFLYYDGYDNVVMDAAAEQKTGEWFDVYKISFRVKGTPADAASVLNSDSIRFANSQKDAELIAGIWPANDSYCLKLTNRSNPAKVFCYNKMPGNTSGDLSGTNYLAEGIVPLKTTAGTLKSLIGIDNNLIRILTPDRSSEIASDGLVGTGCVIQIITDVGDVLDEKTIIVKGDANGDGISNNDDIESALAHILDKKILDYIDSFDYNDDNKIDITDIIGSMKP